MRKKRLHNYCAQFSGKQINNCFLLNNNFTPKYLDKIKHFIKAQHV